MGTMYVSGNFGNYDESPKHSFFTVQRNIVPEQHPELEDGQLEVIEQRTKHTHKRHVVRTKPALTRVELAALCDCITLPLHQ